MGAVLQEQGGLLHVMSAEKVYAGISRIQVAPLGGEGRILLQSDGRKGERKSVYHVFQTCGRHTIPPQKPFRLYPASVSPDSRSA